jgi:hypothetical protein
MKNDKQRKSTELRSKMEVPIERVEFITKRNGAIYLLADCST